VERRRPRTSGKPSPRRWARSPGLSARVYRSMRRMVELIVLTAGILSAQRRQVGDPGPAAEPASLADSILAAHNEVRRSVGVRDLVWSERLASFAQEWADTLASNGQFYHRHKSTYGENLYKITGGSIAPSNVVEQWAAEARDYQYKSNTCRSVCGHYTQIVWRSTK